MKRSKIERKLTFSISIPYQKSSFNFLLFFRSNVDIILPLRGKWQEYYRDFSWTLHPASPKDKYLWKPSSLDQIQKINICAIIKIETLLVLCQFLHAFISGGVGGSWCSIRSLMKCIDLWNPSGNQDTKSSCHSKETSSCCPFLVTPAPKLQSLAITAQFSIGTFCNKLPECFIKWNHAVFQDWLFFFFFFS